MGSALHGAHNAFPLPVSPCPRVSVSPCPRVLCAPSPAPHPKVLGQPRRVRSAAAAAGPGPEPVGDTAQTGSIGKTCSFRQPALCPDAARRWGTDGEDRDGMGRGKDSEVCPRIALA